MKILPIIYLAYMFIALYMFFFFLLLYLRNRKHLFEYPKTKKIYSLSIIIPCYNEEKGIRGTIESVLKTDYRGLKKVIVVDDCSTDNSFQIIREIAKKNKKVIAVQTPKNTGNAAGAKNYGIKFANTELIGFSDADSFIQRDAISKMTGFFDDKETGAVTCAVLVKETDNFIRKLQAFEYSMIAWTRKLLEYIEGIWATPGPLAIYRASIIRKIGGYDSKNLTEDIEIVWRIVKNGWKVKMCLAARVYSTAPKKFSYWFKQRVRWDVGGLQCINKYKSLFMKKGMLGFFIIPFFTLSLMLGLIGMGVFFYVAGTNIIQNFLFVDYTARAGTHLLALEEINLTPTILNFFGIVLFLLGLFFTLAGLGVMGEKRGGIRNIFNLLFYMIIYLTVYPSIMIFAIGKILKYRIQGKRIGWLTK
ncbi:glycosyltransferase family 2 protein [Candidatus Pacearchaeota archaeon]|nr:glycosyltransferase family 2 protein [Candidatus Pacearchaeota archaeon]